jgi:mono/diheme cytochrome c family protein
LEVIVDLRERFEPFKQIIAVETSAGTNQILLEIKTPELTPREKDQRAAFADRQAVFKNQCVTCHLQPAKGQPMEGRYRVLCGTCHDAKHRAAMVPDLAPVKKTRDQAYWEQWLRRGKPGTLMPAFSKPFGGPLTEEEIGAMLSYLQQRFPSTPAPAHSVP